MEREETTSIESEPINRAAYETVSIYTRVSVQTIYYEP